MRLENPFYSQVFMLPELRCGIQTRPGTIRFRFVKTDEFVRPSNPRKPRNAIKTKKMGNAQWSRVYRMSTREVLFLDLFGAQIVFLWRTTCKAPEHFCFLNV